MFHIHKWGVWSIIQVRSIYGKTFEVQERSCLKCGFTRREYIR